MPEAHLPNSDHVIGVVGSYLAPGYYVGCSCGWKPHPTHAYSRDEAEGLGREHVATAFSTKEQP